MTDTDPLESIAPPTNTAWLPANELVVIVSGPLSTMIAPPLPLGALFAENEELLIL